jgi:hypothetical protein
MGGEKPMRAAFGTSVCTKTDLTRFGLSANDFEATGMDSRHANPDQPIPKDTKIMLLPEAKKLIFRIADAWLDMKGVTPFVWRYEHPWGDCRA